MFTRLSPRHLVVVTAASIALSLACATSAPAQTSAPAAPGGPFVLEKPVAESLRELAKPSNDSERFQLGIAQSLHAVERLSASLYEYGLRDKGIGNYLPILRIPVPVNPNAKPVSAKAIDAMLENFASDLAVAIKTLEDVKDPAVKVPARVGMIPLDLDGEGNAPPTPAWQLLQRIGAVNNVNADNAAAFTIAFDLGDARWLQGYCHLLSAMSNMATAYEKKDLVERTGQLFFAKVETRHPISPADAQMEDLILDAIAFVHLVNLPVRDAAHMQSARDHLKATLSLSRESFDAILAETDNDREWIPNPGQQSVIPNQRISREIIDGWLAFVGDCEQALDGKLLIPFWRNSGQNRGINLQKVFADPRPFDLILTIQGTNLTPYLEEGPLATGTSFQRLQRLLGGDFFTFAAWVN